MAESDGPPRVVHVLLLLVLLPLVTAQTPCDPLDPINGNTLTVEIKEIDPFTTNTGQAFNPQNAANAELDYRDDIRVAGSPSTVQLTLEQGVASLDPNSYFAIVNDNNVFFLSLIRGIDRDGATAATTDDITEQTFTLRCNARTATNPRTYNLRVIIKDVNDNLPIFFGAPYSIGVNELAPVGSTVFSDISAQDIDALGNGQIHYAIVPGAGGILDGSTRFEIANPAAGIVTVKEVLDFEALNVQGLSTYVLNVTATDQAAVASTRRTAFSTFRVTITDGNDLPPAFDYATCTRFNGICFNPRYTTFAQSDVSPGTLNTQLTLFPNPGNNNNDATQMQARDRDTLNVAIKFFIQETVPPGFETYFSLAETAFGTGLYQCTITQTRYIQRSAAATTIQLIVRAEEQNERRYYERAMVTLTVRAANNFAPTISSSIGFTGFVPENAPIGTLVKDRLGNNLLKLTVSDQDVLSVDTQTYTLSVLNTGLFTLISDDKIEAYVRLAVNSLDYETTKIVVFTVVARENTPEQRSATATLTVSVQDENDFSPVFPTRADLIPMLEGDYTNLPVRILTLTATDQDTGINGQVSYSIANVNNNGFGLFSITPATGELRVVGSLRQNTLYSVIVQAIDQAVNPRFSQTTVLVNVTRAGYNSTPYFPANTFNVYISEGMPIASSVFQATAFDADNDVLTYSMISTVNTQINPDLTINSNNGTVLVSRRLDRETIPTYTYIIYAADTSQRSATMTLSVSLYDINDNSPFFSRNYSFTVPENEVNYAVGTVQASDNDQVNTPNSQISYLLDSGRFTINNGSGEITTTQPLDYEAQTTYLLLVIARDQAQDSRTGTTTVTINVQDRDDNVPIFEQTLYFVTVLENQKNAEVVTVNAVDADATPLRTYVLTGQDATVFRVNPNGQIFTTQALDFETKNLYEFFATTTQGQNSFRPSATATIRVNVADQNDFAPQVTLSPSNVTKLETTSLSDLVAQASAVDQDPRNTLNSRFAFSILSVSPVSGTDLFFINPNTGRIYLSHFFNSDTQRPSVYLITVEARDFGSPSLAGQATLTVNVIRNAAAPAAPVFNQNSFYVILTMSLFCSIGC